MEIQLALVVAFHVHPVSVDTLTDSRPPADPIESLDRLSENTHGAPAWLTWTVSPAIAIAPERGDGTGFAATE
jgi:hypothetical protein